VLIFLAQRLLNVQMTQNTQHFYEFGQFRIDSSNRLLMKDGEHVPLRPKVVETLLVLLERHGQVLRTDELMDRIWPDTSVTVHSLEVNISRLREAIGDDFIETIPRNGYRFAGAVHEFDAEANAEDRLRTGRRSTRFIWVGTALFVILAVRLGWELRRISPEHRPIPPLSGAGGLVGDISADTSNYYAAYGGRISPDGTRVAFLAQTQASGKRIIFVREMDTGNVEPIEEPVSDVTPFFWSHDGKSLYFLTGKFLKRKQIGQGSAETIAQMAGFPRGTMNRDGVVLLGSSKGILRLLPGGRFSRITVAKENGPDKESAHTAPYFLPDGVTFLFLAHSDRPDTGVVMTLCSGRIDAPNNHRRIGPISSRVEWNANHLLYARDGVLYARPWSLETQSFVGPEVLVMRDIYCRAGTSDADFSVARNGLLIVKGAASGSRLERVRPGANPIPIPGLGQAQVVGITVARHLAVLALQLMPRRSDLWAWDLTDDSRSKLTMIGTNKSPVLNPTGEEVYYTETFSNSSTIYRMSIATRAKRLVLAGVGDLLPLGISSDGELLLFATYRGNDSDLSCLNLKTGEVIPIADSPKENEGGTGRFSPDGKKIVFVSDVSGDRRVYVTPFPRNGAPARPISPSSGWRARWSNDGKKIYYLQRRVLFEYDIQTHVVRELHHSDFDILHMEPTGRGEFLLASYPVEPPNRIVLNWPNYVGRER
jgi:DNA-binding winged helix-turn-helix (wHTH) protein